MFCFVFQQQLMDQMMSQQDLSQVLIPTPTAMIIKQANMSPLPARHIQPSPTLSRHPVIMPSAQRPHPSTIASPVSSPILQRRQSQSPQPSTRSGFINAQRPPSVSRKFSPPPSPMASPLVHPRMQPQRSPSPLARGPSPPHSPCVSMIYRSPPASPRASVRQHSSPLSPCASMRRQSPPNSVTPAHSSFGGKKINAPPSPPLSLGHVSSPLSPRLSRRQSPSPSLRSISLTGPRPARSSPALSRCSTRLLKDPIPLARPRVGGHIPLGTVRPSPMGLRGRPVPPPTQNVRPFRASSIRSNRSSVLTVDSLHSSPFHSPEVVRRTPLRRKESGRFPPRPLGRGHPLMVQQSLRLKSPGSPQPPLKHMSHPASLHVSPHFSHQSSPRLSPRGTQLPTIAPESSVSGAFADPHTQQLHQDFHPSSPMLSSALQNEAIQQASLTSNLGPGQAQVVGMAEIAGEYVESYSPFSPSISAAMQNQAIRDASYVTSFPRPISLHEQSIPLSHPMLSGALQNQAVREASYASPLPRPHSPYATSVRSAPLLSGAMNHSQTLKGVASFPAPQLHSPYGPIVVTPYDYISEPGPAPLLHDALQNRSSLQNVSSLRTPMMQHRNPYAPAGPKVHSVLQQNPNLQYASYQTPMQFRWSPYEPPPPSSPTLGRALQNPQLIQASYRLPDGTLMSPYVDSRTSPLLSHALQNQQVRGASYVLPDGSVIRVCTKGEFQKISSTGYECLFSYGIME